MKNKYRIRLFMRQKLFSGGLLELSEKVSHYLCNVMRCQAEDVIGCFNAEDGEFLCRIRKADKKKTVVSVDEQTRLPAKEQDLWLLFAPLKKDKTDFVIEKAVELGVSRIIPVITEHTNTDKVRIERLAAQAVEAAEQCGRLSVPVIDVPVDMNSLLQNWDPTRQLFFMNERRSGKDAADAFSGCAGKKAALLIGPEGGFSLTEVLALTAKPFVSDIRLGPLILRAETAAVAALAVWQALAGDWRDNGECR